jgi:hypothetical protein
MALNITERLEFAPEQLLAALNDLVVDKYVLLCGKCMMPLQRRTVTLAYEFGCAYSSEFYCTGINCHNVLMPIPRSQALGRFVERREL